MRKGVVNPQKRGLHLIYCDYGDNGLSRPNYFNASSLTAPYSNPVWVCIGLTIGALYAFTSFQKRNMGSSVLLVFAVILKQHVGKERALCLASLALETLISLYEGSIAARLIAPVKEKRLKTLEDVLEKGYEIHGTPLGSSIRGLLFPDFKRIHMEHRIEELVHEPKSPDFEEALNTLSPLYPNRTIAFIVDDPYMVVNYISQKLGHNCYQIENFAALFSTFDVFVLRIQTYLKQLRSRMEDMGLINWWESWFLLSSEFTRRKSEKLNPLKSGRKYVVLENIVPLLLISGCILAASFVLFVGENAYFRLYKHKVTPVTLFINDYE